MRDVPQINQSTGISSDYFEEYNTKAVALAWDEASIKMGLPKDRKERLAELFKGYPIKNYREHFPPTEFRGVVNDDNGAAVSRLDEIAGEANSKFIDPLKFTLDDFRGAIVEVCLLVYGSGTRYNPGF